MQFYDQKVCVVTGAASGIGRASALALASFGAKTVITDLRKDMLDETIQLIKDAGGVAEAHILDVAERDGVYDLAAHVEKTHGGADFVLNNAGVAMVAHVDELGIDDFNWLMDIDFWGVVYGTQAFLPQMRTKNTRARIANVSSVFGLFCVTEQAAYNAAKFAVLGFTDAVRHDLANTNIKVTTIHPGGINTNIVRHARVGQAPDAETRRQEAIVKFEKFTMTQPEKAARIILKGVAKGKPRILVGPDAVYMDIIRRLFPSNYLRLMPFPRLDDS